MAFVVQESDPSRVTDSVVALNSQSTAKLVGFVVENDVAGLSSFLDALVKRYDHDSSSNRPKYYLGDVLNSPGGGGWSPLHHAFHLRRHDCAKLLIDAGEK
jgi:ankyrin repeat protein